MATTRIPVILLASTALTASGSTTGATSELGDVNQTAGQVAIEINVTAVSGTTPSATFTVQWSNDGSTWATADPVDTFTAITAVSHVVKTFAVKGKQFRVAYTITGTTPSLTTAITAIGT